MTTAQLGEIASIVRGIAFPKEDKRAEPLPGHVACLRTTNVQRTVEWEDLWFVPEKHVKRDEQLVRSGDILISTANSYELVGKVAPVVGIPHKATLGAFISLIRPNERVEPKFLYYQLAWGKTQSRIRETASTTTNISNVSTKKLLTLEMFTPPLEAQREIVSELEKQFSRLDEAVANLQRVKANLKRYRASVLNDAVEGRLVECDSPVELVKLGSVANLIDPQPSHRTPPTHPDGVPYIGIGDVLENGKLDFQNSRKVSPTVLEEHRARYTLSVGDFIFGKIGTLGRPTLLTPPFAYTLSANVVLVQADGVRLLPEYALIFMDSPKLLNMISRDAKATTQAAYGIKRMRDLEINIPDIEQQRKIVAEVDRHLSIIREVETEVDANLQRAQSLRQAVLSRAFLEGVK